MTVNEQRKGIYRLIVNLLPQINKGWVAPGGMFPLPRFYLERRWNWTIVSCLLLAPAFPEYPHWESSCTIPACSTREISALMCSFCPHTVSAQGSQLKSGKQRSMGPRSKGKESFVSASNSSWLSRYGDSSLLVKNT